jgi:AcrR family transcriptional regulator
MSDSVNQGPRRRYDSTGRQARARQTRAEICDAARRLFEEHGYGPTTIAEIARSARVSPETIFKAFGSKSALLGAVVTAAVRGDAEATPLRQRPVIDAIRREQDPRRQLAMYGSLLADVNPRLAPLVRVLREAASGDPDTASALELLNANRLDGMSEFAGLLHDRGALRAGVSKAEARDVLWTLNSPELYQLLVVERGWSARRYGKWVTQQLAAALLGETA